MEVFKRIFFGNYLLMVAVIGWVAAQVGKTITHFIVVGKLDASRLVGSGGMPSSHASMVCALFVGAIRQYGPSSPHSAITLVLACIVMYDAMGVRLETGKQARLLNLIVEDLREERDEEAAEGEAEKIEPDYGDKLKELVGHTPLQVLSGALLGVLIAILVPVF